MGAARIDPVTFEIVRNALDSITEQMTLTVRRTGRSAIATEIGDITSAIADPSGTVVGEGVGIAIHMGSIADTMPWIIDEFKGQFSPGDVVICNDPYHGGTHLPDIIICRPMFLPGGPLIGFAAISVHHVDVGGHWPGSMSPRSTEIFQEGIRIPPVKLYEAGRPNHGVHRVIELNVRVPDSVFGDIAAQAAGCLTAEREYLGLVARYGVDALQDYQRELADYSERVARKAIARFPEGTYEFVDYLDDDGISAQSPPLKIGVKIIIHGDSMTIDLSDSSPQVKAAVNACGSGVKAPAMLPVRAALGVDVPLNAGLERCVRLITRPGTFLHPVFPGPVAARGLTAFRVFDAVCGALAQAVPDRIPAAGAGGINNITFSTFKGNRNVLLVSDGPGDSFGARPTKDGFGGVMPVVAAVSDNPVEIVESKAPIRIERYGFAADTGGPGKFRGGPAVVREYRFLDERGSMVMRSDRRKFQPWGLAGGEAGTPSWNILNPGPGQEVLPTKGEWQIKRNDIVRRVTAGTGGFGSPFERDPDAVQVDVKNGLVTAESARRDYGVALKEDGSVDPQETARLRAGEKTRLRGVEKTES